MRNELIFEPESRTGAVFQIGLILFLLIASGWGIWQAAHSRIGPVFMLYLLPALVSIGLVPVLVYRLYALLGAFYQLEREGMRLRWGLRIVDIPMGAIQWVAPVAELKMSPPKPWFRWPGSMLGTRRMPDGSTIEYLASNSRDLILVSTHRHMYAISPMRTSEFREMFQHFMELGSITPIEARSIYPAFLMARIWRLRSARTLLLTGFVLNILLLALVSFIVPTRASIVLGFIPGSAPVPVVRLLLLPVLSGFFFLFDAFLGLFFYRGDVNPPPIEADLAPDVDFRIEPSRSAGARERGLNRLLRGLNTGITNLREEVALVPGAFLAHLLWVGGIITPILLMLAVWFMLQAAG